jgi:hypothetical protein
MTARKAPPVMLVVILPKRSQYTMAVRVSAIQAGIALDAPYEVWPRFAFVSNETPNAKELRSVDRSLKYAEADEMITKAAMHVARGGKVHLLIGPDVNCIMSPANGAWPTIPGHELLIDLATMATAIYVAPGSNLGEVPEYGTEPREPKDDRERQSC